MPFCINCGVELSDNVKMCPLCSFTMPNASMDDSTSQQYTASYAQIDEESARKTQTILTIEILSVVFAIANLAVLAIDFALNRTLTWSLYPAIAITSLWIYAILMLIIVKKTWKNIAISACVVIFLLAGIDLADGVMSWFLPLGLPICISSFLLIFIIIMAIRAGKRYSIIIVFISIGICIESCVVDFFVASYLGTQPFTWSIIVAICMVPLILAGLFHYYVLSRYFDMGKYLHF